MKLSKEQKLKYYYVARVNRFAIVRTRKKIIYVANYTGTTETNGLFEKCTSF